MTDYPYEPPERAFSDTLLAMRDFEMAGTWRVRVEPDPLGRRHYAHPVNQVVTLMRGRHRVKSVLARLPVGASVRLVHDAGSPYIRYWSDDWRELGRELGRSPGWRVEIDDRTVLAVTDFDAHLRTPYVAPPVALWTRLRRTTRQRARSAADGLAGRLGYHRDDDCRDY